jgi:hypothetical protein
MYTKEDSGFLHLPAPLRTPICVRDFEALTDGSAYHPYNESAGETLKVRRLDCSQKPVYVVELDAPPYQETRALVTDLVPTLSPQVLGSGGLLAGNLLATRHFWVATDDDHYGDLGKKQGNGPVPYPVPTGLTDGVLDHVYNRKIAKHLGYRYVRLCWISRGANSSSGRSVETQSLAQHKAQHPPVRRMEGAAPDHRDDLTNPAYRVARAGYAAPSELTKMLNLKVGGNLHNFAGMQHVLAAMSRPR